MKHRDYYRDLYNVLSDNGKSFVIDDRTVDYLVSKGFVSQCSDADFSEHIAFIILGQPRQNDLKGFLQTDIEKIETLIKDLTKQIENKKEELKKLKKRMYILSNPALLKNIKCSHCGVRNLILDESERTDLAFETSCWLCNNNVLKSTSNTFTIVRKVKGAGKLLQESEFDKYQQYTDKYKADLVQPTYYNKETKQVEVNPLFKKLYGDPFEKTKQETNKRIKEANKILREEEERG